MARATRSAAARGTRPHATTEDRHVSAEVVLDARNPIPFENGNYSYSAQGGMKYVPFFPPKDDFLDKILEARSLSPTQDACVNTKTDYTIGEGIYVSNMPDGQEEPQDWKDWTKRVNNKRQSLNNVIRSCIDSYYGTGNAPVEVVRTTVGSKRFVYIYRKNVLDCRFAYPEDDYSMEPTHVLVSRSFRKKGYIPNENNWKRIPLYKGDKPASWLQDGNVERTFLWLKCEKTGFDFYGLPSSISSIVYQVLEYEGARFNLDNLENNMVVDAILTLAGNLGPKEAQRIGKQIISQHTGKGKRGRVAVVASEEGIKDSALQNLTTHKDGSYLEQDALCEKKILLSNQWNAELAGLQKSGGSLGKGGSYLQELLDQAYETVLRPFIVTLIEQLLNPILEICASWMAPGWKKFQVDIKPTQISQRNSEAATTVDGLTTFLDIIRLIASGAYTIEAATQLVMGWYGLTEAEAKARLGIITKVDPNVLPQPTPKKGSNNSGRGN